MTKRIALSVVAACLLVTDPSSAGMYKCTDSKGRTDYQEKPCADDKSPGTQIELNTRAPGKPLPKSSSNKKLLAYYTVYENQKVIVNA
ncbi:MAG: DUF4124 domain-containing protein [Gammaproteobacteria bacterium]|nr:DUF4124 domain-containing protein [Gammaproteobacteria bacterium]